MRLRQSSRVDELMQRRLAPAMSTCESVARRPLELSGGGPCGDLLRTGVDIAREMQNQQTAGVNPDIAIPVGAYRSGDSACH